MYPLRIFLCLGLNSEHYTRWKFPGSLQSYFSQWLNLRTFFFFSSIGTARHYFLGNQELSSSVLGGIFWRSHLSDPRAINRPLWAANGVGNVS